MEAMDDLTASIPKVGGKRGRSRSPFDIPSRGSLKATGSSPELQHTFLRVAVRTHFMFGLSSQRGTRDDSNYHIQGIHATASCLPPIEPGV